MAAMAGGQRLRGTQHTGDWMHGQQVARRDLKQDYFWLQPCEQPIHIMQRDGPLQRLRPRLTHTQSLGALPSGLGGSPSAASPMQPKRSGCLPKTHGKKHPKLWAAGTSGPTSQPMSAEEQEWRRIASTAVRASVKVGPRSSQRGLPASQQARGSRRRRGGSVPPGGSPLQDTMPTVEAWDSISQAPSHPGTPSGHRGLGDWEAQSAETATQSQYQLPHHQRDDYRIAEHLARQRGGWYDWHGGRVFG